MFFFFFGGGGRIFDVIIIFIPDFTMGKATPVFTLLPWELKMLFRIVS